MPYAIIRSGGKQYRVEPGDLVRLESLAGDVGSEISFGEVLMRSTDGGLEVGAPLIADARVAGTIVAHEKARKILVFKKKRRKGYRRHQGHRQQHTVVRVESVA
jgi:large subunit ribosomal protein L21